MKIFNRKPKPDSVSQMKPASDYVQSRTPTKLKGKRPEKFKLEPHERVPLPKHLRRMSAEGVNTADKKPEVVKDPETHKTRVRMVPVDKEVIKREGMKTFKKMRQERALSKAELKKRNDVAKAIKKDDPDMPMDKKMAIATSVAKKTAESKVDELSMSMKDLSKTGLSKSASPNKDKLKKDLERLKKGVSEVSSNTLGNYMRKSAAAAAKPGASARTQDKRIGGQKMADNKIRKKMGYSSPAKVPAGKNEEVEEGKARDRLLKIMNKASGRTMADREKDAAAATARRKEADKDLQSFRQKMGK